jgi:oligopeptide transport system permease protein
MGRYILQRVGYMLIALLVIASFTFFLNQLLPGSPYNDEKLTEAQIELLDKRYGLDDPVPVQYVRYIANLVQGDLGVSFQYDGRSISKMIGERIGASATLGAEAMIFGTFIGIILGSIAALKHNTFADYGTMIFAVLGVSIPNFVFAGLLQVWIGVKLQWLPVAFWDGPEHHVLPALALSMGVIATIARFMRTEMIEVLGQDYIVTARAKGVSRFSVVFKHALRNSMIPIITILGPMAVGIMTGTLVIENIFGIPGLGEQFIKSIMLNDFPMIMGVTLFFSILFISIILIVDILYGVIDPRIRLAGGKE